MVVYKEDFLETITGISFPGKKWLFVSQLGKVNAFAVNIFTIDFPDQAGGTPGLVPFNGTGVGNGQASYLTPGPPFVPTPALERGVLRTNAGAQLHGYGWYDARPFQTPFTRVAIKIDGLMPKSTFRVSVTTSVPPDPGGVNSSIIVTTVGPRGQVDEKSSDQQIGVPHVFRINPTSLAIEGPI